VAELSGREQEVLYWVALGLTNDEVARRLWLSPHTVRTHLQHIYGKLGVRTRTEAAARLRSS
jgi:DNA-binding CsgD family transcriptional regulator